ncbi:MAG: histidine kinase [Rikenellaceae bacterium]|nr:histidine kinase [Rikenellaceae bacterium]
MNFFESLKSYNTQLGWSLILSLIVIYPNINQFMWAHFSPPDSGHHQIWSTAKIIYFIYRYLFFTLLTFILIRTNVSKANSALKNRFWTSFFISLAAYALYVFIGLTIDYTVRSDCFTQLVILQFLIAWLVPVLIGHIYNLTVIQREREREIERLKTESLQSRVDALSNQINPHFFFNSLNGLAALAAAEKHEETTEYISKLSGIFRYILQSDKKSLVKLEEELKFLDAYRYLIEIRYKGKIFFDINIRKEDYRLNIPVLSLLPLIENIIKHNIIDSDHKMTAKIYTENKQLVISNPIYIKIDTDSSNGIGLSNLSARYKLIMGEGIGITKENGYFTVKLPLKG